MANCKDYVDNGLYEDVLTSDQKEILSQFKENYLCPVADSLKSRGREINPETFDYVKVSILGCDIGNECFPYSELSKSLIKFIQLKA